MEKINITRTVLQNCYIANIIAMYTTVSLQVQHEDFNKHNLTLTYILRCWLCC